MDPFTAALLGIGGSLISGGIQGSAQGKASRYGADRQLEGSKYATDAQKQMQLQQLAQQYAQLMGMQSGQEDALARATNQYDLSNNAFLQNTSGTPQAITDLQSMIRRQQTPEQQQALAQGKVALNQAGVRGPEAALMSTMQSNQLAQSLGDTVNSIGLQQQLADRARRAEYGANQSNIALQTRFQPVQKMQNIRQNEMPSWLTNTRQNNSKIIRRAF